MPNMVVGNVGQAPQDFLAMMSLRTLRVLLVEDSELVAQRVSDLIDYLPNVRLVATAGDEQGAIQVLEQEPIDAVILDVRLRQGTGFGVLRRLPVVMPDRPPLAIVFTNYDLPEYRQKAASLGVSHFLDKSRDYDELGRLLQGACDVYDDL